MSVLWAQKSLEPEGRHFLGKKLPKKDRVALQIALFISMHLAVAAGPQGTAPHLRTQDRSA